MSVLDQIRALDEQKAKLLQGAKDEALKTAHDAVATLGELGFNYRLVESGGVTGGNSSAPRQRSSTGSRRTGIREDVLRVVSEHGEGVSRSKILELMDAKGEKSAEQSISNALAALKKAGTITLANGVYKAS
jgi:hypothetical protein